MFAVSSMGASRGLAARVGWSRHVRPAELVPTVGAPDAISHFDGRLARCLVSRLEIFAGSGCRDIGLFGRSR